MIPQEVRSMGVPRPSATSRMLSSYQHSPTLQCDVQMCFSKGSAVRSLWDMQVSAVSLMQSFQCTRMH